MRYTVERYLRPNEVGILRPDGRLELIDGTIAETAPGDRTDGNPASGLTIQETGPQDCQIHAGPAGQNAPRPGIALLTPEQPADRTGIITDSADVLLIAEAGAYDTEPPHDSTPGSVPEFWILAPVSAVIRRGGNQAPAPTPTSGDSTASAP